jgi:hypothetical protein
VILPGFLVEFSRSHGAAWERVNPTLSEPAGSWTVSLSWRGRDTSLRLRYPVAHDHSGGSLTYGLAMLECSTSFPESSALTLEVEAGYYFLTGWLRQDLVVGDSTFDDRYIIRCSYPPLMPTFLDAVVRNQLHGAYDANALFPASLRIARGQAQVAAQLREGASVDTTLGILDAIVTMPERQRAPWEQLAAAVNGRVVGSRWQLDGDFALAVPRPGLTVTVTPRLAAADTARGPFLRTEVEIDRPAAMSFSGTIHGTEGAALLPRSVYRNKRRQPSWTDWDIHGDSRAVPVAPRQQLSQAHAYAIVCDPTKIRLLLAGEVTEPRRILAAVDAVSALAMTETSAGPYR